MKLSKRLQAIYDYVLEGSIVADIGCDHGLVSCALALNNKSNKIYACDINTKPLEKAQETINLYKVNDKVTCILSDGLANVPQDSNEVIIAGMGYDTIAHILDSSQSRLSNFKQIIVQANKDLNKLRQYISDHNYHIISECCIHEDHFYQIIVFNCEYDNSLNSSELLFGRKMIKDNTYYEMWNYYLNNYQNIIKNIDKNNIQYDEFNNKINMIKNELNNR